MAQRSGFGNELTASHDVGLDAAASELAEAEIVTGINAAIRNAFLQERDDASLGANGGGLIASLLSSDNLTDRSGF